MGCSSCYILILPIESGSVLVPVNIYYPSANEQQPLVSEQDLATKITAQLETVFSRTFVSTYGLPTIVEDAIVNYASAPPTSPPPLPLDSGVIQSFLRLDTMPQFGDGSFANPYFVTSTELSFTLSFSSAIGGAGVTGLDVADIEVLTYELWRGEHFIVFMNPSDAFSTVTSVTIRLLAVGIWPSCGIQSQVIKIQLRQGSFVPASSIYTRVLASNAIHIHWAPGPEHVVECSQPVSQLLPPPPPPQPRDAVIEFTIKFEGLFLANITDDFNIIYQNRLQYLLETKAAVEILNIRGDPLMVETRISILQGIVNDVATEERRIIARLNEAGFLHKLAADIEDAMADDYRGPKPPPSLPTSQPPLQTPSPQLLLPPSPQLLLPPPPRSPPLHSPPPNPAMPPAGTPASPSLPMQGPPPPVSPQPFMPPANQLVPSPSYTTNGDEDHDSSTDNSLVIIAVVVAAFVFVLIVGLLFFYFRKRRQSVLAVNRPGSGDENENNDPLLQ